MADVFISYHVSPGTTALVRDIADELESMGLSCWYAPRNVTPGAFVPSILSAIDCCKVFLLILDEDANGPGYVYNETVEAFNCYKKDKQPLIIPFKLGTFQVARELNFYLRSFHIFNGGASAETANTDELIVKISGLFDKAPQYEPRHVRPPRREPQSAPRYAPPSAKIIKRGDCGDNVTYTLDENGLLTISGRGPMWDMFLGKTSPWPWKSERENVVHVTIQDGVTAIGSGAFGGAFFTCMPNLTDVDIPDSVTVIRLYAFASCQKLRNVRIPDSVTKIEHYAFADCAGLTRIDIPDNVREIGQNAFDGCTGLTSVHIPHGVTKIKEWTFGKCAGLTSITIPDNVREIGDSAFHGCTGLTRVKIPDSVTTIGLCAFADCENLQGVSVPLGAKISFDAFPDSVRVRFRSRK